MGIREGIVALLGDRMMYKISFPSYGNLGGFTPGRFYRMAFYGETGDREIPDAYTGKSAIGR